MTTNDPVFLGLRAQIGEPLLLFLLGIDGDDLPARLTARQTETLECLSGLTAELQRTDHRLPVALALPGATGELAPGWHLRAKSGSDRPREIGDTEIELELSRVARDAYVILASQPARVLIVGFGRTYAPTVPLLFDDFVARHPLGRRLAAGLQREIAVRPGARLASAAVVEPLQHLVQPARFLDAAARRLRHSSESDAASFMALTVECMRELRRVVAEGSIAIPAAIGFSALPLDHSATAELPQGRLRPATAGECRYAPFGQLADAVLETEVEALVVAAGEEASRPQIEGEERLSRARRDLILASALASPTHPPVSIPAVAWSVELPPAGLETASRPLHPPNPVARTDPFGEGELQALRDWAAQLAAVDLSHVEIAVDRMMRALWEPEATESLIDAVIAWENLLGTRTESAFRVTAALVMLCEDDPSLRLARRRDLGRVYDARSRLVHGDPPDGPVHDLRAEAVRTGLQAISRLVDHRSDLLELRRSSARADRLLMGVPRQI